MESGRRTDDRPWVRNARKTVQWTVFSGERAAAPKESSSVLRSSEKEQAPQCGVATIEDAEARRRDSIKKLRHKANVIKIMVLIRGQRELTAKKRWSVFFILKAISKKSIRNKQMLSSAMKMCIIQLLGYSVEEAYCRLEFDFARV